MWIRLSKSYQNDILDFVKKEKERKEGKKREERKRKSLSKNETVGPH